MALRYLRGSGRSQRGSGFVRFIMAIAVSGVALGVAALLLSLAIVRGFSEEIEAKIVGFGAHVQVESMLDAPLANSRALQSQLEQYPEVQHVTPVVTEFVLLRHGRTAIEGVTLWGTDAPPAYLADQVETGSFSLQADSGGTPGVVIGRALAEALQVDVGERLTAFAVAPESMLGSSTRAMPRLRQFVVNGIFETSLDRFDEIYAFIDLAQARSLFDYEPAEVSRLDVMLEDVALADSIAARIDRQFAYPVMSRTIYQVYSGLFAWVNLQQGIIPLVIGIIVLVAAVNIIGLLLIIILEHSRSIGILGSMGATGRMLRRVYLFVGLLVGTVGVVIGEVLAFVLARIQQRFEVIPLPAEAYYMSYAPVSLRALDFVIVAAITLALCLLAAYLPARVAARMEPIRTIRFR